MLVPEYEKKFMMDNAMGDHEAYFKRFYEALINHRFSLIISEPLFLNTGDSTRSFAEENDAWVKWVSTPLLEHYRILRNFKAIGLQLLVPRER